MRREQGGDVSDNRVRQVDPQTGQNWPLASDTEGSEIEVEEQIGVGMATQTGVGVETQTGGDVEQQRRLVDDPMNAARSLIRAQVR